MANERKTERLVRNILTNKGYFEDANSKAPAKKEPKT